MSISTTFIFILALLAGVHLPVAATPGFLTASSDHLHRDRIVGKPNSSLGHGQNYERLAAIRELLRPTFVALPKDNSGSLVNRAARYALYRYLLVQHGWHIKGLSPDVGKKHTSSTSEALMPRVPAFIMESLEKAMGSDHVGLDELTVSAATIEDLVHSDAVGLLGRAYKALGLSPDMSLDAKRADLLIRTFTMYFMFPQTLRFARNQSRTLALVTKEAQRYYPGWESVMLWVEDVKQGLDFQDRSFLRPFVAIARKRLDFSSMAHLAAVISASFGQFSDLECKEMKNQLLDLDGTDRADGRVSLARFYAAYSAGSSVHFSESPAYLRHLGVLDEHFPQMPSVIVPNMMYSRSNCVAESGFYAVCCTDACEVLMVGLEEQASQSEASPALIAAVVSAMPSDTVTAPRNLSAPLLSRLDELAGRNGGSVPLHSRLFAQWMHYAFPNECPYPRPLLTAEAQLTPWEWASRHNSLAQASKDEMQAFVFLVGSDEAADAGEGSVLLWSEDEELLVPDSAVLSSALRWFALSVALATSVSAICRNACACRRGSLEKGGKHD